MGEVISYLQALQLVLYCSAKQESTRRFHTRNNKLTRSERCGRRESTYSDMRMHGSEWVSESRVRENRMHGLKGGRWGG